MLTLRGEYIGEEADVAVLRSALEFLKDNKIGKYFEDPRLNVDSAIEEMFHRNIREELTRHPKIVELRGLCAALLRREPIILPNLRTQPSYPALARIIGYSAHSGVIEAANKYARELEHILEKNKVMQSISAQ